MNVWVIDSGYDCLIPAMIAHYGALRMDCMQQPTYWWHFALLDLGSSLGCDTT